MRADLGRQPLAGEQLVHGDPGDPRHPQCGGRGDGALAGRHLLDAIPVRSALTVADVTARLLDLR